MELDFTAEQEDLRDSIRAVLAKESPITLARRVIETGAPPTELWATFVELGWPALTVPEADGGVGLGAVEAAILAEELGRAVAPGPLLSTVTQFVPMVRECGTHEQRTRWLGEVAAGTCSGTVAIAEATGSFDPAECAASLRVDGDRVRLSGTKRFVVEGDAVDEVVVVVQGGAVVVPAAAIAWEPVRALDGSRRVAHAPLDGIEVSADRVLGAATGAALRRALEASTVALALEMVGTAQAVFDVSLDYAKHRHQFGVPIGSFQAIKHKFADMLIALERARATGYFAALTIAEDDPRRSRAVSVAKAAAGDCQRLLGKEGIQIHGGIGYTWEHDMQVYVKRMKSGEALFGTSVWHRARIADALGV